MMTRLPANHCMTSISPLPLSAVILLSLLPVVAAVACPTQCDCRQMPAATVDAGSGILHVDCRGRQIADLADVVGGLPSETVVDLDVGDNPIVAVDRASFAALPVPPPRLRSVLLDGCQLAGRLNSLTFADVGRTLEVLDLSANAIDKLDVDVFQGLIALRQLRLDLNRLGDGSLPDLVFRGLSLTELRLDANELTTLTVHGAVNISLLNLDKNRLTNITGDSFRSLRSSLTSLSISDNSGQSGLAIADDAFQGFAFTVLRLANSKLTRLGFLENVASVESLDVGGNPLGDRGLVLSWSSALALSCREAHLDRVGLTVVDPSLASSFRSAWRLNLSSNLLGGVLDADLFRSMSELRLLDLAENSISNLSAGFFQRLPASMRMLNLSGNFLSQVDLRGADRLSTLDLSRNRFQIFPEVSARSVFELLGAGLRLSGNPLHCNCETAWLRVWAVDSARTVNGVAQGTGGTTDDALRCASPEQVAGFWLVNLTESAFVCRAPTLTFRTPSSVVLENSTVILSCTADGDPAPVVSWTSPAGGVVRISPPPDRTQTRTSAVWVRANMRREHSGWYICVASNAISTNRTGYTYVHVRAHDDPEVDLTGLEYPMIPPIVGGSSQSESNSTVAPTMITSRTVFHQTSADDYSEMLTSRTSSSSDAALSGLPSTSTGYSNDYSNRFVSGDVDDDALSTSTLRSPDGEVDGDGSAWKILIIVGIVAGGCLVVALVVIATVCIVRKQRRRRQPMDGHRIRGGDDYIRHVPGVSILTPAPPGVSRPTRMTDWTADPVDPLSPSPRPGYYTTADQEDPLLDRDVGDDSNNLRTFKTSQRSADPRRPGDRVESTPLNVAPPGESVS